jgi:hypothetical protein
MRRSSPKGRSSGCSPPSSPSGSGHLLHKLTPRQREVLVLRIAVGLSAEETAQVVGSTPGAVRVTQHRALNRLRGVIGGPLEVDPEDPDDMPRHRRRRPSPPDRSHRPPADGRASRHPGGARPAPGSSLTTIIFARGWVSEEGTGDGWPDRCVDRGGGLRGLLVLLLAVPLLKLGRTLDEATTAIRKAHEGSAPLLDDAQDHPCARSTPNSTASTASPPARARSRATCPCSPRCSPPPSAVRSFAPRVLLRPQQGHQGPARREERGQAPPSPPEARRMKRMFWLGVGPRRGRVQHPARHRGRASAYAGRGRRQPGRRAARARGRARRVRGRGGGPAWSPASRSSTTWSSAAPAGTSRRWARR